MDLTVQIRVDKRGLNELERVFWEVSDPQHKNYGDHRTPEQIRQILGVPKERISLVRNFFFDQGVSKVQISPHGDILTVRAPAHVFEKALLCELYHFSHSEWSRVNIVRS